MAIDEANARAMRRAVNVVIRNLARVSDDQLETLIKAAMLEHTERARVEEAHTFTEWSNAELRRGQRAQAAIDAVLKPPRVAYQCPICGAFIPRTVRGTCKRCGTEWNNAR